MKILYIGETWFGSCAHNCNLREALVRQTNVELDDLGEDTLFSRPGALWLRALNRLTMPVYRKEFNEQC